MKKLFLAGLTFLFFHCSYSQQKFQLAAPILKYNSVFFIGSATASLQFAQPGTQILYTLNGEEPTENDLVYQSPIVIKKSFTTLKAKVFGNSYLPSETVQVTFIKDGSKIKSIEQPAANEKFTGNGAKTLFDNEGGIADMHNKNFLGYQQDSIEINVLLEKKQPIHSLLLDFLQDEGSWIFLPQKIEIFYYNNKRKNFEILAKKEIFTDTIINGNSCVFEIIKPHKKINANKLKIILQPLQHIPEGPGKGKQGWLFIDEIKIY
jgi:hypothetical protein